MGLFSRVLASLTRNFGKTILLLLIIFILGCIISGAISVNQAIQNTDTNIRRVLPPVVSIETDWATMDAHANATGEWLEPETVTLEMLSQIGELPYVRNYDASIGAGLMSLEFERVAADESMVWSMGGDWDSLSIKGVHSADLVDIEEGIIELTAGRMLTEQEATTLSYVALISEEFAQLNDLHVGSSMMLENIVWDYPEEGLSGDDTVFDEFYGNEDNIHARRSYDFEVIGIFRSIAEFNMQDEWNEASARDEHLNRVYASNPVAMEIHSFQIEAMREISPDDEWLQGDIEDLVWLQNVYILNNSEDIAAFRAAAEDVLPDFWIVIDSSDAFSDVASSMESLGNMATLILWIAISASVIILSLLITLFLRERRREIGIYLALGEGRGKVSLQMMIEVLAVAFIAIVLALFAGNLIAGGISEVMLRNDMAAGQGADDMHIVTNNLEWMGFGAADVTAEEILATYNVSLDATGILMFFAASIGTVIVATIVPMLYILRLNPRKIMI